MRVIYDCFRCCNDRPVDEGIPGAYSEVPGDRSSNNRFDAPPTPAWQSIVGFAFTKLVALFCGCSRHRETTENTTENNQKKSSKKTDHLYYFDKLAELANRQLSKKDEHINTQAERLHAYATALLNQNRADQEDRAAWRLLHNQQQQRADLLQEALTQEQQRCAENAERAQKEKQEKVLERAVGKLWRNGLRNRNQKVEDRFQRLRHNVKTHNGKCFLTKAFTSVKLPEENS